jgi:hypothetical protein
VNIKPLPLQNTYLANAAGITAANIPVNDLQKISRTAEANDAIQKLLF